MQSVVDSFYPEPGKLAAIIVEINSDIGDLCHGWACATPGDQFIDRDICTFNNDLNLPGLAVPDPPCQSQIVCLLFCRTSIPDALNVARDKQVGTIFLRFGVRRSHSKEVCSGHMVYTLYRTERVRAGFHPLEFCLGAHLVPTSTYLIQYSIRNLVEG